MTNARTIDNDYRFNEIADISAPIIKGEEIGGFVIGANINNYKNYILSKLTSKDRPIIEVELGLNLIYRICNGILSLKFDVLTGLLISISAKKGYNGLYLGKFIPGEFTKNDLFNLNEDFEYYGKGYSLSPHHKGIGFKISQNIDDEILDIKSSKDFYINEIEVFIRYLDGSDNWLLGPEW